MTRSARSSTSARGAGRCCGPVLLHRRHIRALSVGEQNGAERNPRNPALPGDSGPVDSPGRPCRGGEFSLTSVRQGTVSRVDSPAPRKRHGGDLNPRRQGANPDVSRHSRLRIRVWGFFVPTGTEAKVTIRTDRGVLPWSSKSGSVQSGRPKRSARRSERNDATPGVNTRGSRSSIITVGPVRGGRRSYLSGSNTVRRALSRGGPPAQRIHRAVAPEPKGLS
jgi:hypothetical protein